MFDIFLITLKERFVYWLRHDINYFSIELAYQNNNIIVKAKGKSRTAVSLNPFLLMPEATWSIEKTQSVCGKIHF